MHISYDKLWHILLDRHMTREFLRKECGISSNTIAKLGKRTKCYHRCTCKNMHLFKL